MTTKKRHCQHPSTSFSDALPFQSLPDLIGQSRAAAFISPDTPVKPEHDRNKKAIIAEKSRRNI